MQKTYYSPLPMPSQGVHAELSDVDLEPTMAADAENFVYRDGRLRVRAGLTSLASSVSTRVTGFAQWVDEGDNVLVMTTTAKYYVWNNATQVWTDLSGSLTGSETTHNVFRVFQLGSASGTTTTMYGQNGVNDMKQYVYGDASVANVTVAGVQPPRAKAMMVLADRMLLGNITDATDTADYTGALGPQVVCVSNSQDPTQGYSSVLVAQLQDTPGEIVAMLEMGNLTGAIYKDDAIYMATAQSDVVPFTFQLAQKVPGPVSPRAVVAVHDGLHIYLASNGDVMTFDGNTATPMDRHIQKYVLDHWNRNMANRSHGWYDHENREVVFVFPDLERGDCSRAIVIRLTDNPPTLWPYSFRNSLRITGAIRALLPGGVTIGSLSGTAIGSLSLTLGEYNSLGTVLIMGSSDGGTYTHEGTTDNGNAIAAFVQYGYNPLNDARTWKSPKYMDMVFKETDSQDVTVEVTGTNHGVATSVGSDTIDIGDDSTHRTYLRGAARRLALRLEADATEEVELQAAYIAYAEQGPR